MTKLLHIRPLLLLFALAMTTPTEALAQTDTFDHFSTGFVLDGGHVNVTCEACHVSGTFGPTGSSCSGCHSETGLVRASAKPTDHVQTEGECSDCHITSSWSVVTYMDHSSVTGSCASCHNGVQATGKTPTHIVTTELCEDCHNTTAWLPAVFDHAGIVDNCMSCHNGTVATGKTPTHIQSTQACEDCHSTST